MEAVKTRARIADRSVAALAIRYIIYGLVMCVLWYAKIYTVTPFASGFYLATVLMGECGWVLAPLYFLSAVLFNREFGFLVGVGVTAVVALAAAVIFKWRKIELNIGIQLMLGMVSRAGFAAMQFPTLGMLAVVLEIVFCLVFMYVVHCALVFTMRFERAGTPLDTELSTLAIVLTLVCQGLSAIPFFGVKLHFVVGFFLVCSVTHVLGKGGGVITSVCVGLGSALNGFEVTELAFFAFISAVFVIFHGVPRVLGLFPPLVAAVLFELYFNVDYSALVFDLASVAAGGAVYAAIPGKWLSRVSERFTFPSPKSVARELVYGGREECARELRRVSEIFDRMSISLRAGLVGHASEADRLSELLTTSVCDACNQCTSRESAALAVRDLVQLSLTGEPVGAMEVPYFLNVSCPHAARLFTTAEREAARITFNRQKTDEDNAFRTGLADELAGVRDIISKTERELIVKSGCDENKERLIKEELAYRGMAVVEAVTDISAVTRVSVILRRDDADEQAVCETVSKVMGGTYTIERSNPTLREGYLALTLIERPELDAVFAVAGASKSRNATGDTHSFTRISPTRFMMALCDGMGSGRAAGRLSERAIDLVECFYRAGFDSGFILENVNRFLVNDFGEGFAAFDILVCDLKEKTRTVIKLGSPASYVKSTGGVAKLEGSALPLGAISELSPYVYTADLVSGEVILFVSDGVSDLFEGDELAYFIGGQSSLNVKTLCENVLARAKQAIKDEQKDDMTVVGVRISSRI